MKDIKTFTILNAELLTQLENGLAGTSHYDSTKWLPPLQTAYCSCLADLNKRSLMAKARIKRTRTIFKQPHQKLDMLS